jgi:hypothetical protein
MSYRFFLLLILSVAVFIACTSPNPIFYTDGGRVDGARAGRSDSSSSSGDRAGGSDDRSGGKPPNGKFVIACTGSGHVCTGVAEYEKCLSSTCDSELKAAFGPGYQSGIINGPCTTMLQCEMACSCDKNFNNCKKMCTSNMPSDCYPALMNLVGCTVGKGCSMSCAGGSGDGGGTG